MNMNIQFIDIGEYRYPMSFSLACVSQMGNFTQAAKKIEEGQDVAEAANMMISAGDFRNGVTFEEDGNVLQVIEFQHVKPGKGAAFVRTKTKNVITGSVVEKSYNPSAKFPTAYIERKDMAYSYNDDGLYYFMDNETFDMIPVSEADLPDSFRFVKENDVCKILSYKGKVFGVEPPTFVTLEVTATEPGVKGNTATNTLKPATVETGAEIRVPLFINEGDMIRIDTRTCEYMERA